VLPTGVRLHAGFGLALLLAASAWGCGEGAGAGSDVAQGAAAAEPAPPAEPAIAPGTTSCADGFAREGSSCTAILPATACTGLTRAALGNTTCVPLDDCSAPLPAGAIVVTDPTALQKTLTAAPRGSTIALEPGTYPGVVITRDLTLVGRCAERVVFEGDGKGRGIEVTNLAHVTLRSVSIRDFELGIAVPRGVAKPSVLDASRIHVSKTRVAISVAGKLSLAESVVEGSLPTDAAAAGVWAADGGKAELRDVESRGVVGAIISRGAGTAVTMRRSVIGYTGVVRENFLVSALDGATLDIAESSLRTRALVVGIASNELGGRPIGDGKVPAKLHVSASEISERGFSGDNAVLQVAAGGALSLEESSVVYETAQAIYATSGGALVDVKSSVVTAIPTGDVLRKAFHVTNGAAASVSASAIVGSVQNAVLVGRPGSSFVLDHSLVTGTRFGKSGPTPESHGFAAAVGAFDGASLSVVDSSIVDSDGIAVYGGARAKVELTRSAIEGVRRIELPLSGMGIIVEDSALAMEGSTLRHCDDTALVFFGGEGLVAGNRFASNAIGIHIQDVAFAEVDQPRAHGENELVVSGNVFEDVATRVSDERIDLRKLNEANSSPP
jgi:hypothetical protein